MKRIITTEMSDKDFKILLKECDDVAVQNIQIQYNVIEDPLDDFIGLEKAAQILNISEHTLKTKTHRKQISYYKPDKKLLFSRKYLLKYISESKKKSNKEIDEED
jgi:pectate lyase